jgi:hypothetical protein
MAQTRGFFDYVFAAFNARPFGMFVAPNWIGLGAFALLGMANQGFWVLGAGLELGYLAMLATNPRFQRAVDMSEATGSEHEWRVKIDDLLARLSEPERRQYLALATRCQAILDQQAQGDHAELGLREQNDGLNRLLWMYLKLLTAKQAIERVLSEAQRGEAIDNRLRDLDAQLTNRELGDDLRRSLTSQAEILRQRVVQQTEARQKLAFVRAELTRIEEQVELIREQAALSTDPEALSRRIDQIVATLGGTGQWIRDQHQVLGAMEDLLADPPPLTSAPRAKESQ